MSNIHSTLNQAGYEMEQQTRNINQKASITNQEWLGKARKQFDESHRALKSTADQIKREVQDMKRVARNLEASMQAADRDMAQKALAQANK